MTKTQFKKLKIGNTVKFRSDLITNNNYGFLRFLDGMETHIGRYVTIDFIDNDVIMICEDPSGFQFCYTPEMFEEIFKFGR